MIGGATTRAEQVVFSEIMYHPPDTRPEYIEVYNNTATPFDVAQWKLRGGVDYDFPPFAAGNPTRTFLKPFERILLSPVDEGTLRAAYNIPANVRIYGPWSGNLDNAGEDIRLEDKNGVTLCTVEYDDRGRWPVAADGGGQSLVLKNPDKKIDDWRNWTASAQRLGTPGTEPITQAETPITNPEVNLSAGLPFVIYGDPWKYHDQNQDLGTAWRAPAFNDSAWLQGPGLLGFETAVLPAPGIRTSWADFDQLTYYARTRFVYNGALSNVTITIDQILDDGAVYYLNGVEIGRSGMSPGTVTFTAAANRTVPDAVEELGVITTNGAALVSGTNVLAVEVHQSTNTSSDVVFGARLSISVPSQPSLIINEVLPGPSGVGFVEIYNPGATPINLRNHYFTDDPGNLQKFRLDSDIIVPARGLASVGFAEVGLVISNTVKIYLVATNGASVINAISTTMPLDGRSIGRKPVGSSSWFLFVDTTRNAPNASQSTLAAELRLNEVHFGAGDTVDWVEFHNISASPISLSGLFLSANSDFSDKVALSGNVPAGGYASQDFALPSPSGEITLFLINSSDTVLAARIFQRSTLGNSLQAFPNGSSEWYASDLSNRDSANNPVRNTNVVINEIMYDPPSDERSGEFIELYNRGSVAVDLSGWRLAEGVSFTIPPDTVLGPDGYLVIAADLAYMRSAYGAVPLLGNFEGQLNNNGEMVRLEDKWGNLVDEVDYMPGGDWPNLANGDGTSMELRNPWMDNALPSAWVDSNETNKAPFQHYSYSDVFRQLRADGAASDYHELHLHLVGDSHVVLQNIQLRLNGSGANLIVNGNQMSTSGSSANGWLAQGTHYASYISGGQLNLIADGHGDNRGNRLEIDTPGMTVNSTYEVSFDARWVAGAPRLVVQTWDHSIATSIALPVPNNLGTPGARNSRFIALPGPQVDAILHSPPVPSAGQAVRVTAKITSPVASSQVLLFHRLDNSNGDGAWANKPMFDNGTSGDQVAGDGIYTAQLTEYGANAQVVQFYVSAQANSQTNQMPKWGRDRPAMYVVDTASAASDLRKMRFVVSAFDLRDLSEQDSPTGSHGYAFPRLSNHYYNMTAIVNERDIIYACEVRNSGSPWTRGGSLDRGKFKFPKDKLFRGKVKQSYDNDASGGPRHHNRITRYWLYLFGHPANENEFFLVEVNAGGNALREEVEPLGNDMLDRIYGDGSLGELYRIDDEWWFQDNWGRVQRDADWSYKGTDNAGRYRTEWMKRTRESEDDHTALISLFKTIAAGTYTQAQIERLVDPLEVMRMSAVRGYTYDWDSFSLNRGKNGYFYRRSTDGKFMFFHWDSDLAFQDANGIFYNGMVGFRPYIERSYNFRLYKHYLARLVESYAQNSPRMNAWLQAEEDASSQYNVSTAYQSWFSARQTPAFNHLGASRTTAFDITSNGGNPITVSSNTINLAGTGPLRVFRVEVVGHPEAVFTWVTENTWTLTGIVLSTGANPLTLNAVNEDGVVLHTDSISVTKNGNAPPVMVLEADPQSWHVSVVEALELDARGSYDPDRSPLAFTWAVNPSDAQLAVESAVPADEATATFPHPGLYTFTVTGQDAGVASTSIQREAAVYAPEGFSPFNDPALEPYWSLSNVELRRNHHTAPYYSVTELEGQLILQVLDDRAFPLGGVTPTYPHISRPLPALTDWVFLTKVTPRGQFFGDYNAGALVEINEGGSIFRYAFGIEDGTLLTVRRITSAGTVSLLRSVAMNAQEAEIRIRRSGNTLFFEQEAVSSGGVWTLIHSAGVPAGSAAVKAGLFLATDTRQTIKVAFDYAMLVDPSATSDLRQNLRISEIMYNPVGGNLYEYVELVNIGNAALDLTGVKFIDGITYTFGPTILGPRQFIVVPKDAAVFASRYDISGINVTPGGYLGQFDNSGETVTLADSNNVVILTLTYRSSGDWPTEPNGGGSSLEARDTSGNLNDPNNWRASPEANGSPGRAGGDALGTVIVNEVLTHTDLPFEDALEVFNRTAQPIDIGGWFLSDARGNFKKYRIPNGTIVPARGHYVFYETDFNDTNKALSAFSFSSVNGDQAYLSAADAAGNLTGYRSSADFDAAFNGVSFGRYETSIGRDFTAMTQRTFGQDNPATVEDFRTGSGLSNAAPRVGPIVINEINYRPPDIGTNDNTQHEFIELFNITTNSVPLYDPAFSTNTWHLRGGADFNFPSGATLPPHGYLLVVSFNPFTNTTALTNFRATYSVPVSVPIYGPYAGRLSNAGEEVRLNRPDAPQPPGAPDAGVVPRVLADRVTYGDSYPWPASADGLGDSLQRRRPHEYGNDPVNLKGAAPTPGRANVPGSGFADFDNDGMPDSYETANSFTTNNPADAGQDADADGKSNYEEFLDATDPRNASDRLNRPVISAHPQNQTVAGGGSASFSVTATGTAPLSYQWRFNGIALIGATNSTLVLANVQHSSAGEYAAVVHNAAGFVISEGATLSLNQALTILAQPQSRIVAIGDNLTFTVFASGTGPLTYQWRFEGANIPGATSASFAVTNAQTSDSGNYSVVVTDSNSSLTSADATLSVLSPPTISQQPQSQTAVAYSDVFFSVVAGGEGPFTYQWRFNGPDIPGATNSVLSLPNVQPNQAGNYSVRVFNSVGSLLSSNAVLTLLIPATITEQPQSANVAPGSTVTFSVTATSSTPIRYQWRFNDVDISGATNRTHTVTNVQEEAAGNYLVVVTDSIGSVRSQVAVLGVIIPLGVVSQPLPQSVPVGSSVTFSVEVRGGPMPFGYEWRRGVTPLESNALFSTRSFLTLTNVQPANAGAYRVVIRAGTAALASFAAQLTVLSDFDQDGLPDAYEQTLGFNTNNAADAWLDFDGDGVNNRDEYFAGTMVTDSNNFQVIESLNIHRSSSVMVDATLSFSARSNKTYTVQYTDNPGAGWLKLDDCVAWPSNHVRTVIDPNPVALRTYRVVTPRQP